MLLSVIVYMVGAADIKFIESMHATIRRRLRARGTQTHGVDFNQLNAEWLLDRARQRNVRQGWRQIQHKSCDFSDYDCDDVSTTIGPESGGDGDEDEEDDAFSSRSSGGGGTWRAYIRHRTLGTTGTPNFRQIALDYRSNYFFHVDNCCLYLSVSLL